MGPIQLAIHLSSFVAPALVLALLLALVAQAFMSKVAPGGSRWAWTALNFVAGVLVLVAGLWFFGRDGKMATYGALVVVMASVQWLGSRGWR
jgi:hypothetical protein